MSKETAFLNEFSGALKGLVRNEKAPINMLSMLAEDNKDYAGGIVNAIEKHILSCPPPAKLPALYLVDSIIKNVGEPYKSKFSERLAEVFGAVWDTTLREKRSSLSRLYGTWTGILPPHVLDHVKNRMVSTSNEGHRAASGAVHAHTAPAAVPLQHLAHQPPVMQQLPPLHASYGLAGQHIQMMQPAPQIFSMPQGFMGMPQQAPTLVQINGTLVPVSALPTQPIVLQAAPQIMPQPTSQHATPQHVMQQHTTPQHAMQALHTASPGHTSWQQQQQLQAPAAGQGPMVRRSPGSPAVQLDATRGPAPPPPGRQQRKSASPMPTSADLTNDALNKLLSNLASSGVLAAKNEAAAMKKVTDFQPAFLKELHPGVLQNLEELSAITRPKFRDVEYQRNKRRTAAAGAAISRTWYLTVDTWIAGTLATEEAIAHNPFDEDEEASASEKEEEYLEPEDPEQPCCAISGEPFDKFFNQDSEEWFYKGAKRIHGEEAARYGVADGSLVKVKCLAEAGLGSGAAAMVAAGGAGEGGDEEVDMAAAAADAPAAGQAAAVTEPEPVADVQQEQQQQRQPAVAVKQEQPHDVDGKAEVWQLSKQEDAAVAAVGQQVGSKREADSPQTAVDGTDEAVGSAAKKPRVEHAV